MSSTLPQTTPAVPVPAPAPVPVRTPAAQPVRTRLPITFQIDNNVQPWYELQNPAQIRGMNQGLAQYNPAPPQQVAPFFQKCGTCHRKLSRAHFAAELYQGKIRRTCEKCRAKGVTRKAAKDAVLKPTNDGYRVRKTTAVDGTITYWAGTPNRQDKRKADSPADDGLGVDESSAGDETVTGMSLSEVKSLTTYSQPDSTCKISDVKNQTRDSSAQTPPSRNQVRFPNIVLTEAPARPPTSPSSAPAEPKNPDTAIHGVFVVANGPPDIFHYTPPTAPDTLSFHPEDALTRLALSTHLEQILNYFHYKNRKSIYERRQFFIKMDELVELTATGSITPWRPLKTWLALYEARAPAVWSGSGFGSRRQYAFHAFTMIRELGNELGIVVRGEMDTAEKDVRKVCRAMGRIGGEKEVLRWIGQVKKRVVGECGKRGCLMVF